MKNYYFFQQKISSNQFNKTKQVNFFQKFLIKTGQQGSVSVVSFQFKTKRVLLNRKKNYALKKF